MAFVVFCVPGCLSVFGRGVWGFFQGGSFDGGVELFLLFWFRRVSSSAIFRAITCN